MSKRVRKPPAPPPAEPDEAYLARRAANNESARKHRENAKKAIEEGKEYKEKYEKLLPEVEEMRKTIAKLESKNRHLTNRLRMSAMFPNGQYPASCVHGQCCSFDNGTFHQSPESTESERSLSEEYFDPNFVHPTQYPTTYDPSEYFANGPVVANNGYDNQLQPIHYSPVNQGASDSFISNGPVVDNCYAYPDQILPSQQPPINHTHSGHVIPDGSAHGGISVVATRDMGSNQPHINNGIVEPSTTNVSAEAGAAVLPTSDSNSKHKDPRPDDFLMRNFTRRSRPSAAGESSQNQQDRTYADFKELVDTKDTGFTPEPGHATPLVDLLNQKPGTSNLPVLPGNVVDDCLSPMVKKMNIG